MLNISVFIILMLVCIFVIDDLFIDLFALLKKLRPQKITDSELKYILDLPERNIAIIIANWKEANILEQMVSGNIKAIQYDKYHIFLGVYPNDVETFQIADELTKRYSQVHLVVNTRNGPTTKGQMMNELVKYVMSEEVNLNIRFNIFLMHDSEDLIHPLSLKLINSEIMNVDFLQIPVFSNERLASEWVGSTYIDEFNEIHTKDMFVRAALGAPVPSAGTGTAIKRNLMIQLIKDGNGNFLKEESLTEDYILGMSSSMMGFKSSFCCRYVLDSSGKNNFIATREHFPNKYKSAIRQKTRWIVGIAFQAANIIPWKGSLAHKYFLYRDRKGPISNILSMLVSVFTIVLLLYPFAYNELPEITNQDWFRAGTLLTTIGMINRLYQRFKAVNLINGRKYSWYVFLRWPVGIIINFFATINAIQKYSISLIKNESLQWVKTNHELPTSFGDKPTSQSNNTVGYQ